jgi:hypothetical protein
MNVHSPNDEQASLVSIITSQSQIVGYSKAPTSDVGAGGAKMPIKGAFRKLFTFLRLLFAFVRNFWNYFFGAAELDARRCFFMGEGKETPVLPGTPFRWRDHAL